MIPLRLGKPQQPAEAVQVPLSRGSSPAPRGPLTAPPSHGLPPIPVGDRPVRLEMRRDGIMQVDRPQAAPPFRLLPQRRTDERLSMEIEAPPVPMSPRPVAAPQRPMRPEMHEVSRLRAELRARPLTESVYGRILVQLLTMPWVYAPSGLAATVFPSSAPSTSAQACADYINDLACGAHAYADSAAGVLAIYALGQFNKMLQRSGLSPIVPMEDKRPWSPLTARRPAAFLLEGFHLHGNEGEMVEADARSELGTAK